MIKQKLKDIADQLSQEEKDSVYEKINSFEPKPKKEKDEFSHIIKMTRRLKFKSDKMKPERKA